MGGCREKDREQDENGGSIRWVRGRQKSGSKVERRGSIRSRKEEGRVRCGGMEKERGIWMGNRRTKEKHFVLVKYIMT